VSEPPVYAAAPRRVAAWLIDALILGVPLGIAHFFLLSDDNVAALGTFATTAYYTITWSRFGGGKTVGMRLLGIRVVSMNGEPIDLWRALMRAMALAISIAVLLLGVALVLVDRKKQGLHDKIARTYVVRG
jgi:uncharacterized RDD family membrane protein YckC